MPHDARVSWPRFLISGFIVGIAYRLLMDPVPERDLANYLRSGLHGVGLALALWAVHTGFASTARPPLARRSGDSRLPAKSSSGRW